MADECIPCAQAKNELDARRKKAILEGAIWAKGQGVEKYAIAKLVNGSGWKHLAFDEPNIERFPAYEYCYL